MTTIWPDRTRRRSLGRTGFQVSALSIGTVSLGTPYGISAKGTEELPSRQSAISLLRHLAAQGVNLFDTAPGYGASEEILGEALGDDTHCLFATKVSIPRDRDGHPLRGKALAESIRESLLNSLNALKREQLDIVQIHNATQDIIESGEMINCLSQAKEAGLIRVLGASVYCDTDALSVIADQRLEVLQVAYSLLDQRKSEVVFREAARNGTAIIARSVLLKGVLTPRARWLPTELESLKAAAEMAVAHFQCTWEDLPFYAIRFGLTPAPVSSVLVGVTDFSEVSEVVEAWKAGPLNERDFRRAAALALSSESLLNPAHWPIP